MNYYSASLRAEMFKYRKRRTPSLDGSVAGLGPVRSFRHARPATPYSHGFSSKSRAGHAWDSPRQSTVYDPQHAFYKWPEPEYEEPEPWFEHIRQPSHAVPEWRSPIHPDPFFRDPAYIPMTEEMFQTAMDEVRATEPPFGNEAVTGMHTEGDFSLTDSLHSPAEPDPFDTNEQDFGYEAAFDPETMAAWDSLHDNMEEADSGWGPEEASPSGPFDHDGGMLTLEDRLAFDEHPNLGWHAPGFEDAPEATYDMPEEASGEVLDAQYEAEHEQVIDADPEFDGYAADPGFGMEDGPPQEEVPNEPDSLDGFSADPEAAMGLEALVEEQMPQEQEAHQDLLDPYSQNPYAPPQTPDEEELQQLLNPFMMPGFFGPGPGP